MSEPLASPSRRSLSRVAVASVAGSLIEQYDFWVTGIVATTVWSQVFFHADTLFAKTLSFLIFVLGILVRPLGAFIYGNLADRYGRKEAMVWTLHLMGISTLLMGFAPSYHQVQAYAPVMLLVFRILQGISFGAEFGTASTWVVEEAARTPHRAKWGAVVSLSIPIGLMLGFGAEGLVKGAMPMEQYLAWGWRLYFFFGFVVAVVGIVIRNRTQESWVFVKRQEELEYRRYKQGLSPRPVDKDAATAELKVSYEIFDGQRTPPAILLWKRLSGRLLHTSLINAVFAAAFYLCFVFGRRYLESTLALGYGNTLLLLTGVAIAMALFMGLGGWAADKWSRTRVLMLTALVLVLWSLTYFVGYGNPQTARHLVMNALGMACIFGFGYGVIPTFFAERFPTACRVSGASFSFQLSEVYGGGTMALLTNLLLHYYPMEAAYRYMLILLIVFALAALLALFFMPDTKAAKLE